MMGMVVKSHHDDGDGGTVCLKDGGGDSAECHSDDGDGGAVSP